MTLEGLEALIHSNCEAILEVSQERRGQKPHPIEDHLRYIRCVSESCVEGSLTEMHSSLWLLDFHDLEERAGAKSFPAFREELGFSIFGMALFIPPVKKEASILTSDVVLGMGSQTVLNNAHHIQRQAGCFPELPSLRSVGRESVASAMDLSE